MKRAILDETLAQSELAHRALSRRGYAVFRQALCPEDGTKGFDGVSLLVCGAPRCAEPVFRRWLEALLAKQQELRVLLAAFAPSELPAEPMEHDRVSILVDGDGLAETVDQAAALLLPNYMPKSVPPTDTLLHPDFRMAYAERLPMRIAKLRSAVSSAKAGRAPLDVARHLAHRLRGTAGTYGFADVGNVAGQIEDALVLAFERGEPDERLWQALETLLRRLTSARASLASPLLGPTEDSIVPTAEALLVVAEATAFVDRVLGAAHAQGLRVIVTTPSRVDKTLLTSVVAAIVDGALGDEALAAASRLRSFERASALPIVFVHRGLTLGGQIRSAEMADVLVVSDESLEDDFVDLLRWVRGEQEEELFRVLVVDDDPDFLAEASRVLARMGVQVHAIQTPEDVLSTLEQWKPDLLLLDVLMPGISGLEVCRTLRKSIRWQTLPIVLVTGRVDDQTRLRAYRAGASDFVSKPLLAEELEARVGVRLAQIRLVRNHAARDSLTGLWNRRYFLEESERPLAQANATGKPCALALIDIDHFKHVNDRHGHVAGDQVLARFGRLLSAKLGRGQLACRWGGEEFLLLMPNTTAERAAQFLETLLRSFAKIRFESSQEGVSFSCNFSAGVAASPDDETSVRGLLPVADERLYLAKSRGRARVVDRSDIDNSEPQ